jgi:hypothetical protein
MRYLLVCDENGMESQARFNSQDRAATAWERARNTCFSATLYSVDRDGLRLLKHFEITEVSSKGEQDFPVTVIGDAEHATKQQQTINRLLRARLKRWSRC